MDCSISIECNKTYLFALFALAWASITLQYCKSNQSLSTAIAIKYNEVKYFFNTFWKVQHALCEFSLNDAKQSFNCAQY